MGKEWSKESNDIFERFAAGIDDAISKGEYLDSADRDLNYGIKLQNERLKRHGVTMKMDLTPRGAWTEGFKLGKCHGDDQFEFYLESRTCKKDESYFKDGKRLYRNVDNYKLSQTVTDFATGENPAERQFKCSGYIEKKCQKRQAPWASQRSIPKGKQQSMADPSKDKQDNLKVSLI